MHFTAQLAVRFEKAFLEDLFYRLLTRTLGLHWPAFPRSSAIFREARETRKKPQKAKKERKKEGKTKITQVLLVMRSWSFVIMLLAVF